MEKPHAVIENRDRVILKKKKKGTEMIGIFKRSISRKSKNRFLPVIRQFIAWRNANKKMKWGISKAEFRRIPEPPGLTESDLRDGYDGVILSYGFGDDGCGYSDSVLSGQLAWLYICTRWLIKTWQCRYIDFDKSDQIRLRPEAPHRPKGFYFTKFKLGDEYLNWTVSRYLKQLNRKDTGCGPEGIQLLTITHPHITKLMNQREIPFMAFADYDIAPYGFNDFFDVLQLFCSNETLGLGIGNVDQNYPLFGIPVLRF